jgi:CHAT domain-containing protein/tetratricopeptide (TPR) repeat protein
VRASPFFRLVRLRLPRLLRGGVAVFAFGTTQAQDIPIPCDEPPIEFEVAVPATLALPAKNGVLLIEELGVDIAIHSRTATALLKWDLPPSGRAYQSADVVADASAQWLLHPAAPSTRRARVRIQLFCDAGWDLAPLRLLARAAADTARAEDGDLDPEVRNQARAQSVATLSALVVVGRGDAVHRRWPWLAAQALQARAFAYARMARPTDSRTDLAVAAAAWRDIGDGLRGAIARHRAAQQLRREGDLAGAERALRELRADAVVRSDPTLVGVVTNDFCLTLRHLLRLREALRCYDQAVSLHDAAANVTEAALSRANRADAYAQLGRYAEAEAEAQAAQLQARSGGRTRAQLLAALVVGNVARAQGRLDGAIQAYLEALSLGERLQDPNLRANALQQLGIAYLLLCDFSRARQFLGEAAKAYEGGGYWNNAVLALRNLADAERRAARPQQAAATIAHALAIVEAGKAGQAAAAELHLLRAEIALQDGATPPLDEAIAAAQSALGDAPSYLHRQRLTIALARRALARNALPAAEAGLREARRAAQRADDIIGLVELDDLQAQVSERRGERVAARRQYETAVQRALRVASLQTYPLHRASFLAQARRSLERLLDLSRADAPGETAARFGAIAALHFAARRGERALAAATPEQAAVLAQVNERVRRRWGIQNSEEELRDTAATPGLFARAQQIDTLARAVPRATDAAALLRAWQRRLRDGDSLIVSFVGERRVFVWTLRRDGLAEHATDTAATLRDAADMLQRSVLDRSVDSAAVSAAAAAVRAAAGLDAVRAGPGLRHYLLADGPLAELPPSLLLAGGERAEAANTIPAVVRIDELEPPADATSCCRGLPLQAFADPSVDSASGTARSAANLPRLPGSRNEAQTIAARWSAAPTKVWLGAAFTRRRALDALAQPQGIVHFATHGFASRDEPGLSALLVAADDAEHGLDVVSFHDLLLTDVRARLVVLGACDTASGGSRPGSSGASLAHALRAAGAETVVAPLWSVDDESGNAFMRAFYDVLGDGAVPADAVAAAQRELALRATTAHPYYWAGFVVFAGVGR